MWLFKLFLFVTLAVTIVTCNENAVICYYGSWAVYRQGGGRFDVDHIDPHACTHLVYTFAGLNDEGNIISLDPTLDITMNNYRRFNALKQRNSNLKTLLAIGGYNEGSAKYSIMAANPRYRLTFINSAIGMCMVYGFDGIDIDWEYPNGRDTVHGEADVNNFTTLLRELREAFDFYRLIMTAGVAASEAAASNFYDIPAISRYLDIVNIMMYDMAGSWNPVTGHNAPLHSIDHGNFYTFARSLQFWINSGCPREKIAVGVPFYTRSFNLANPHITGVGAPSTGAGLGGPYTVTPGTMGYNEFCFKLRTEPWNRRYDGVAQVPYAFLQNDWVTYDNEDSIVAKIQFARSLGVTKAMIWSIETDDFHGRCATGINPLLRAVNRAIWQ